MKKYPRYYIVDDEVEGELFYRKFDPDIGCFVNVFSDGCEYVTGITVYDDFQDRQYGVKSRRATAAEVALKFGFVK